MSERPVPGRGGPSNGSPHPLEQRSAPRVATWLPAQVKLGGGGWISCHLRDVGTGGACLQTDSPLGVSDLRWLQIELPQRSLKMAIVGRWQREAGPEQAIITGVEFDSPEREQQEQLETFVHERLLGLVRFIQRCPDLSDFSLDEAMDVALVSRLRAAKAGRYLLRGGPEGTADDSVYLVSEGSITLEAEVHKLRFPVGTIERGGVFGGISLLAPGVKPHLAAVAGRELMMLEVDRSSYEYLQRAKPVIAARLANVIVSRHVAQLSDCIERVVARLS